MTGVPRREVREIVIGAVGLAALVAVLMLSYGRGTTDGSQRAGTIRLSALFDQIDGLDEGDPVLLAGVRVGRVAGFTLTDDHRAEVAFDIEPHVEVFADAAAAIHTDGLFGDKFLRIDPGGGDSRRLGDGDTVAYTQKAFLVSEILDLIIAAGQAARTGADPAAAEAPAASTPTPEPR